MNPANAVIVLARAPVAARMDVRLCDRVNEARAHEPERADAIATLGRSPRSYELVVAFSPPHAAPTVRLWLNGADRYDPRPLGTDPAVAISSAMDAAFRRGHERVVVVGMGEVERLVTRDRIEDALQWLEQVDCVIGALDGHALWLIGSRTPLAWLRDMPWGADSVVLAMLREELVAADLSWCEIDRTDVRVGELQKGELKTRPAAPA